MDPLQLFTASRLAVVAGKGGVGKTTVTAVIARAAALQGAKVLVIDVDRRPGLAALLGGPRAGDPGTLNGDTGILPYDELELVDGIGPDGAGRISGRSLSAATALVEYLDDHGMKRVSRRLVSSGVVDVVSTAAPGIDDLLVLGKVKQLERSGAYDLIVVDGPAAGHAITFLLAAAGLLDAVRGGPINVQAREVLQMLRDPTRCQVILVTIPEETPVNETIETAFALEDRVGVQLGPVVVNALDTDGLSVPITAPPSRTRARDALAQAATFRHRRAVAQHEQAERLAAALPLAQVHLPYVFAAGLDAGHVEALSDVLRTTEAHGR